MLALPVVTDPLHNLRGNGLRVDLRKAAARDLAHVDDDVGANHRLARNVRLTIGFETRVKNRIGNLVRHLVGMSFRNRLRRKDVAMFFLHFHPL